jgi:glucosamine-6-phosphate deaminase
VPEGLSARSFLLERLVEPLGIGGACLMRDASGTEAARVENELAVAGADLVVHGIGVNGHLGFNEPGSTFDSRAREVDLHESTIRSKRGEFGDGPPKRGCTLGLEVLLGAPRSLLLATGDHKRRALERALYRPVSRAMPASGLRLGGDVTVIADSAAQPDAAGAAARVVAVGAHR